MTAFPDTQLSWPLAPSTSSAGLTCKRVKNALQQAMKEILNRFDLKGSGSQASLEGEQIVLTSSEYKIGAVRDVVESRLVKRKVPLKALSWGTIEESLGGAVRQKGDLQKGIPTDKAREIVKRIKQEKLKVQASIDG